MANAYEADLPRAFRFMTRGLGTRETRSNDMLSLVMFQQDYVKHLIGHRRSRRGGEAPGRSGGSSRLFRARTHFAPRVRAGLSLRSPCTGNLGLS